ncbi:hypothetical protein OS493_030785 [Desmophyllum pertusum]|uniref:Uncharacterized protein n=1 Tax=Desmophyllum pertusum TaxID=174260 RepID=A0A9W9YWD8_9CNID|nr:hypothetical protein OS493_030785 [Desmophyllum pertusum]
MAENGRSQNRAYSPYAVDSLEDGPKHELSTFKSSYQNPAYENSEIAHQYEDPSRLVDTISLRNTGPRRKRNELYEPTELRKHAEQETKSEDYNEAVDLTGDSWLSRLILFLILVVSLTSLLLVVLIILGKVGPSCSCNKNAAQDDLTMLYYGIQSLFNSLH